VAAASAKPSGLGMVSPSHRDAAGRRCRPMAPQSHSGSLENGGADMLLMTSNTRSGGVGQGHAVPPKRSERTRVPARAFFARVGWQAQSLDGRWSGGYSRHRRPTLCFQYVHAQ
jgi:hypothetical protein